METEIPAIIIVIAISTIFFCAGFIISYLKSNKYLKDIDKMMDNLTEKYLITEIMPKPSRAERLAYYRILKKANKSMLENIINYKTATERLQRIYRKLGTRNKNTNYISKITM